MQRRRPSREMKKESPDQFSFNFAPEIIPQGNGTFLVRPGKPIPGRKKLTIAEAAEQSRLSEDTIARLYNSGILEGEKPSPRKIFIYEDALESHLKSSRDRQFWDQQDRRQLYLKAV